jgi:hypothetical protein
MTRSCDFHLDRLCSSRHRSAHPIQRSKTQEKAEMPTLICGQDTEAAQQNETLRKPPEGLNCGTSRSLGVKPKCTWQSEYDAYLKAQYFGGLNRRFRVLNLMIRLTGLPRWYIRRQAARLGNTWFRTMEEKGVRHAQVEMEHGPDRQLEGSLGRVAMKYWISQKTKRVFQGGQGGLYWLGLAFSQWVEVRPSSGQRVVLRMHTAIPRGIVVAPNLAR